MAIKIPIVEAQRPAIHLIISTISTLVKNKMVLESRLDFISELTNSKSSSVSCSPDLFSMLFIY
jgi:hypothetical protein